MSYTQLIYHIVLRTHRSERTLSEAHERDLYNYMYGFVRNNQGVTFGMLRTRTSPHTVVCGVTHTLVGVVRCLRH